MFCDAEVALFLNEQKITCGSFVEFEMTCDEKTGPCKKIKDLYLNIKGK